MTAKQYKKLIKTSGLKQNYIADKLALSREHLNRILNGSVSMPEYVDRNLETLLRPSR